MPAEKGYSSVTIEKADNGFTLRAYAHGSFETDSINEIHTDVDSALASAKKILAMKPPKKKSGHNSDHATDMTAPG